MSGLFEKAKAMINAGPPAPAGASTGALAGPPLPEEATPNAAYITHPLRDPARVIGEPAAGRLGVGLPADVVVLTNELEIERVLLAGEDRLS